MEIEESLLFNLVVDRFWFIFWSVLWLLCILRLLCLLQLLLDRLAY